MIVNYLVILGVLAIVPIIMFYLIKPDVFVMDYHPAKRMLDYTLEKIDKRFCAAVLIWIVYLPFAILYFH